ncbi:site-specific integrase [Psychromonas algarum]|uniref:site-specific integrase n=1 Tax=Psychromonas algarum TaxID=2555643 RepID=UPI0014195D1D|nr:site-specific integrase [Psychromonas sp. RZ22]
MNEIISGWHQHLSTELAEHSLSKRECIGTFLSIDAVYRRLTGAKTWPKNALSRLPSILKKEISTSDELQVFSECLALIYEREQIRQPNLLPPQKIQLMPTMPAAITTKNISPSTCSALIKEIYQTSDCIIGSGVNKVNDEAWGKLLLLIALESNLNTFNELDEFLTISYDNFCSYSSANDITISLPRNHRRVWLQPCSALLLNALVTRTIRPKLKAKKLIEAYRNHISSQLPEIANMRASSIIRDIGLFHQPLGLRDFWQSEQSLPDLTIDRLFGGNIVTSPIKRNHPTYSIASVIPERNNNKAGDVKVEREVHSILSHYALNDKNESRHSEDFKYAQNLLSNCLNKDISEGLYLTIYWINEIFTHGTAWKGKLTVSTIKAYFSTILSFTRMSYQRQSIQSLSSEKLTEYCQDGLDSFNNANQQFTVLRFLKFIEQSPQIKEIRIDELLLMDNQGVVRSNYLSPKEFEVICCEYLKGKGIYEYKIVFFMRCCYYIGLREDEALNLQLGDINLETEIVSVTPGKRRKTKAGVRDIPFSIMPESFVTELIQTVQEKRLFEGEQYLFSEWDYANLEKQFIAFVRDYTQDTSWVTHLLRHAFANNLLLLLTLTTQQLKELPSFFECDLFSKAQQTRTLKSFESWGRKLDKAFPILDWIAQTVGHAGPLTTSTIYLHLLDWVISKKYAIPYPISKAQLQDWIGTESKYVFEMQKKIGHNINGSPCLLDLNKQATMNQLVKKTFSLGKKVSRHTIDKGKRKPTTFCFSIFVDALQRMKKGSQDSFFDGQFLTFIKEHCNIPNIPEIAPYEIHAWVRLGQHLDEHLDKKIQSKVKALLFLKEKLANNKKEVTNIKDLKKVLHALNALGFSGCKISIKGNNKTITSHWSDVIKANDFIPIFSITEKKMTSVNIKPYQLHSRIWRHTLAVIELVTYYKLYKKYILVNQRSNGIYS